ncbi:MAG: 2-hydroxyacyl-CoA dehydratase family protein [Flintibacter sp.]|jgi:bcr-type benzoyl-CoA reductase subunit C|uniref:(R)-2-hydroxyglutaryl-CoA dehydratase subunit beta n=1 Tax=Flintibacter sp. TaxID=1918624 RepID=UPI000D782294|nr:MULTISPECIES: (R)-2-hydroxyglutaryl-CoA dehydratase subunit beta [Eubacteriales]MDY5038523.1 (R)-2-hydroxyglutaryl-CoA dehydratase subunit beta [Lawsonibacter sp.]MCF2676876.1 2-hydroxyacyl-CoA dehydratase [Pseudoflavonifractor phocaeensis]MCI6149379.1 2-hydroxyacyl-CoA dehydratase family protein [Flintibacter sp.]MCI7660276.1 2-hydroxyacyl-CoA dehydratase family protein [Flintibacter sp.]MDD7116124.1 (R)-2-hydroxyglutaryl-CoA dehydratase subunit beta [Flintibacter sp.]
MSTEVLLNEFKECSEHPYRVISAYKQEGKKVIGVLPYFAPVELVVAAGMVPMGIWGSNKKTIAQAKEYCATFYCTIAQLALEMLLDGTLDQLDGIITPTICDTLRPMSQNFRVAMEGKLPCIFLAHPQNRKPAFGLQFTVDQYMHVKSELEKISGNTITDEALRDAIKVMNRSRKARREFVKLAGQHPEAISAVERSAVLRSAWFMEPAVHAQKLEELNEELSKLPASNWKGRKVVTSGIICDNPKLLQIFDDNNIAIAADDVAQETRAFRVDASEEGDPMMALAQQFADQDYDVLLYDEYSNKNRRADYVVQMVKESGAQGLVLFMQQFCDPEEMEYPYLKKALDDAGIPHIKLGVDQQMRDFGQASTAIQAFADVL